MTDEKELLKQVGHFTWFWDHVFFIETKTGNFIWSDPRYPIGDNTLTEYDGTYDDFCKRNVVTYGRDKGKHIIGEYCPGVKLIK